MNRRVLLWGAQSELRVFLAKTSSVLLHIMFVCVLLYFFIKLEIKKMLYNVETVLLLIFILEERIAALPLRS